MQENSSLKNFHRFWVLMAGIAATQLCTDKDDLLSAEKHEVNHWR
jgi:hypothetical protein